MGISQTMRIRLLAALGLAVATSLIGFTLLDPRWRPGAIGLQASYDTLHSLAGPRLDATSNSPVVLIYLDLKSFLDTKQDPALPWPRTLHAKLLDRLTAAGARAVVFDIIFSQPGRSPDADRALTEAISRNRRVILAAQYNNKASSETDDAREWARVGTIEPVYQPFASAAAGWGIATLRIADDKAVRQFAAGFPDRNIPTVAWAAARFLKVHAASNTAGMREANARWIRYYGPPLAIPHVSYTQALDPAGVSDYFFKDRIVFIGSRPQVEIFNALQDEFRSPFHSWRNKEFFMPGVEVHATELLNLLRNDPLSRMGGHTELLLVIAAAIIFGGGLPWLRPVPATLVALAGALLVLGGSLAAFSQGTWFPWMIVSLAQIPAALSGSIIVKSADWYLTRRKLEAAKKVADAKIREQAALIDKAHDAILVQDLNGNLLYSNPSAQSLYGWTAVDLADKTIPKKLRPMDDGVAETARTVALNKGEWNGELRQQTALGRIVTVASRWTLIRDDSGKPNALLIINSDVTEQKALEAQFLRTQRMNTVGTLAGGMAHDLNNALAPILMGVQLLRRKTADEESMKLLGLMETNTLRGADMIRQVLLFARGRGNDLEPLDLAPIIAEVRKMVLETFPKNIRTECFVPGDLWRARANATQIHQVLLNLCVNARDAMPNGGQLSFAADNVQLDQAQADALPDAKPGEYISLIVSDTGSGMLPEVQARIFEPFFTTKSEGRGTGIGLATVLRIVRNHGGCVRVESQPGQGTTFEVLLPRAKVETTAETAADVAEPPRGSDELILVAEDEQAVRDLMRESLTSHGYRVLAAADGLEAERLFREHQATLRLLITDTAMPGLDGPGLIASVRAANSAVPIILTSGQEQDSRPLPDGAVRLPKPFSLVELLTAIAQCLGKK